jgi:hypothetical protein
MGNSVKFKDVPKDELQSILVQRISGDDHEQEMYLLIATFTAYNLSNELGVKLFNELTTKEIAENLNNFLYSDFEGEDIAWKCAIETLGEKIFDIIDKFDEYMEVYLQITQPIENLLDTMLAIFTKI